MLNDKITEDINNISKDKFVLVQDDVKILDKELVTKPIGYFEDAWLRFKRNKGSVIAAIIIVILILFAIFVPMISKYEMKFTDGFYSYTLPKHDAFAKLGFWDGCKDYEYNQKTYDYLKGIPGAIKETKSVREDNGENYYTVNVDTYMRPGYVYKSLTKDEFEALREYDAKQPEGKKVMFPMVNTRKIKNPGFQKDPNYWFESTMKGVAILDEDGNYKPIYKVDSETGEYAYWETKMGGDQYKVRVLYYEYFNYANGFYPEFIFGTDGFGQDVLVRLAFGARLSLMLGFCVAAVNIFNGTIWGAIEGYYGGLTDLLMERFAEILGSVPSIVTFALFQMYFASKVGVVWTLVFAFLLTGWIGPAWRVRSQFYRFKGQEYVLAARTLGARDKRIIFRHILPNAIGTIITSTVLIVPGVIFSESTLSYLGIVDLQTSNVTSVGTLLKNGQSCLSTFPHVILFPSLFISLLMISFNLFGNGLRDALNPSLRGTEN